MHSIHCILLQAAQNNYTGFVTKAGVIVVLLVLLIIFQAVFSRKKKNRIIMERDLLQQQFNSQIMQYQIEIQEATFDNLSAELHDNIGQLVSTAKMFIGVTERKLSSPPMSLIAANETLDKAITELRSLSKSLNKDWLKQFDLYSNLTVDAERINAGGELTILLGENVELPLSPEAQFILYRLLQEGIQNVVKHAAARQVLINITQRENIIVACLQDNGKGFDIKEQQTGLGIKIMRQRVKLLKGKIDWESSGLGTRISIHLPVKKL